MPKQVSYKESSWGGFFKPEAGGYPAIIVGVMELGTESKTYKEWDDPKDVVEVRVVYEIEAEQEIYDTEKEELTWETEDKIWLIGQNYTEVVSDKSKLWAVIKAVYDVKSVKDIKNFSLDKLLWLKAYIEVDLVWKKKNIEIVKSVSWLNKKMEKLIHEQVRENFYFWMEDINDFSEELMEDKEALKPWDIDRIKASPEYKVLCKNMGIKVPETLDEQEETLKKEAAENKAKQEKANSEPTVWEEDVKDIFNWEDIIKDEPKTTTEAREKSKKNSEFE